MNHHRWRWVELPFLRGGGGSHGAFGERRVFLQIIAVVSRFGAESCRRFYTFVRMKGVSALGNQKETDEPVHSRYQHNGEQTLNQLKIRNELHSVQRVI